MKNILLCISTAALTILAVLLNSEFVSVSSERSFGVNSLQCVSFTAPSSTAEATENTRIPIPDPSSFSIAPLPATPFHLEVGAATLSGTSYVPAVAFGLTAEEVPPMGPGMVNVTAEYAAYRINVSLDALGSMDVSIPYDTMLLPQGFTEDEISTYCYDKKIGMWLSVPRDSVATGLRLILSSAELSAPSGEGGEGPLDFINAVIKTPEMPEAASYTPTSIKELEAANPLEGLTMMQPPTANNSGTANMSYPIEIPAGRQGLQPNLALTYSSGGGNGWLGMGWDISIPSITVETRWGVPRYDSLKESEVYVLEGEQLLTYDSLIEDFRKMPHRTNRWTDRNDLDQDGYEQFYPRKNELFDSIVRHGSGPSNYWWSVTHRNGVTDFYGKRFGTDSVEYGSVLSDPSTHNIAQWMLTETVDADGNWVRYYYDTVSYARQSNGIRGIQIYPSRIEYTGWSSISADTAEQGAYSILFHRKGGTREDVSVSLNNGFREVSAELLCNLCVNYLDTEIRSYSFFFENGRRTMFKTRLSDVVRIDGGRVGDVKCYESADHWDGYNCVRTRLEYFDAPEADSIFGNETIIDLNGSDDRIRSFFVTNTFNSGGEGSASALGATKGKSWNVGGTATVGAGPVVPLTSFSVGGNFNYGRSQSEGSLTLIDLDGDGLADKVFKMGGRIYYRKCIATSDTEFQYGDTACIDGISDFLHETSSTTTWGLQASAGCAYSGSWPYTESITSVYFSDVNADGLPDLITDDGVLFNVTENGTVRFRNFFIPEDDDMQPTTVSDTVVTGEQDCAGIIFDGTVDPDVACRVNWVLEASYGYPYDEYLPALQDSVNTGRYELVYRYISYDSTRNKYDSKHTVVDLYRKQIVCAPVSPDPDLETVKVWVAQSDGTVDITSNIRLLQEDSRSFAQSRRRDGIGYSVQICKNVNADSQYRLHCDSTPSILLRDSISADDHALHSRTLNNVSVTLGDIIMFRLQSGTSRSFDKVIWEQEITYDDNSDTYNSTRDFLVSGDKYFQAHKNESEYEMDIHCKALADASGPAVLSVVTTVGNAPTTPDSYPIVAGDDFTLNMSGPLMESDQIRLFLSASDYGAFDVRPHIRYMFPDTINGHPVTDTVDYYPPVTAITDNYNQTREDTVCHWLFGPLYKGWGQFAYNNNDTVGGLVVHDSIIDLSMLIPTVIPRPQDQQDAENDTSAIGHFVPITNTDSPQEPESVAGSYQASGMFNPLSTFTKWVEMQPDSRHGAWVGYGNINYIVKDTLSNTRMPEYSADENTQDIAEYDHPVPVSPNGRTVKTIRKVNTSNMKNQSLSISVPVIPISVGASNSVGENTVITDYMDLNGDRYPDFVGPVKVQYSQPWGGIGPIRDLSQQVQGVSSSATLSEGCNFGGSYSLPTRGTSNNPKGAKISFDGSGNVGASLGGGNDNSEYTWMDVNGDGLPDKVYAIGGVALNQGYSFQPFENWGVNVVREGSSRNFGLNMGANFNIGQASIGGGIGVNLSRNWTDKTLMDFNGDGLPDIVEKSGGTLLVKYNIGDGRWSDQDTVTGISQISFGRSYSESADASVTLGVTVFSVLKICVGVSGSPYNKSFSKDSVQLTDINGDGYIDYVTSQSEDAMTVRYNQSGKTNLLRKVTNFTGSSFELDYEMPLSCFEKPQRSWNLARVEVRNNVDTCPVGGNRALTTFSYANPHYDRTERMDYGYENVTTFQWDTDGPTDTLYRYTVENYDNIQFSRRGKKTRDCIYDALGRPYVEHLYEVVMADFSNGDTAQEACPSIRYKSRETDICKYYEGDTYAHIITAVQRDYDQKRNVTKYINFGYSWNNPAGNDEYFEADISYKKGMPHNLISLQDSVVVKDRTGNMLQKRSANYDSLGHLTHLVQYIHTTNNPEFDFLYDKYGNIVKSTYPKNLNNQRLWCRYEYDTVLHSYPVKVGNAYGYSSYTEYDYKFGKPTKTIDINGNKMLYEYDSVGRMLKVTAPYEQDSHAPYTISFEYHPYYYDKADSLRSNTSPYSYAVTRHYDLQNPTNPIQTVLIADGLGRLLQTKKDAEIGGVEVSLVTGKIEYDCFGRTLRQYYPFIEPITLDTVYNDSITSGSATETYYDVLDRQTRVVLPMGGYTTSYRYGFGTHNGNTCFQTTVTDPKGNQVSTFLGSRQQQLKTVAPMNTVTTFAYSPLVQLLQSTDPDGLTTSYQYDKLGRMTRRTHPDAGIDTYTYDPAGNLIKHVNGNGQSVEYDFNYSQLMEIRHSDYPENDVRYQYGAPGAAYNRAGRIMFQEDASGWQVFSYGKLGEVTENIRTFALPYESKPYTFRMKYKYDSFNRVQNMTYPDGELVSYHYNRGGMLDSIGGRKGSELYPYVDHIAYNRFELKDSVLYGNGSLTTYSYDTLMRLKHLFCTDGLGDTLQKLDYRYDAASNILGITNNASTLANNLGGRYHSIFSYDSLYRLVNSNGSWDGIPNTYYTLGTTYSRNGRITGKKVDARAVRNNAYGNTIGYDRRYSYYGGSNRVAGIADENYTQRFDWDGNGNLVRHTNISEGCVRQYCWDEENRMQGAIDCKYASFYMYDANGERTYKFTGQNIQHGLDADISNYSSFYDPTLYASPYVVCTPRGYTKHYYAESERVASKIGNGCLTDLNKTINTSADFNKKDVDRNAYLLDSQTLNSAFMDKASANKGFFITVMKCLNSKEWSIKGLLNPLNEYINCQDDREKECYWYHPDHLGSSSWITFSDGSAVQHLHYLPWGEDFVDQRSTSWSARFVFSAKERDVETGLSYFGARYYSSDLSIWLSVDPMSDKYPSSSPYVYCANNPVKLVDSNGEDWYENELTGDVYYNRDYRKGDERKIDGEGWKWMGKNNMFDKSDDDAINTNLDKAINVSCRQDGIDGIANATFKGENAEAFMNNMGYKKRPLVQDVEVKSVTQSFPDAMGPHSFSHTETSEHTVKTLSWTYAKNTSSSRYSVLSRKNVKDNINIFSATHTYSATERRKYDYSMSSKGQTVISVFVEALNTASKMF